MLIIPRILNTQKEYIVPLVDVKKFKKNMPIAVIPFEDIWDSESIKSKLLAIIKLKYKPTKNKLKEASRKIFIREIFGTFDDMGELLYELASWHFSRDWKEDNLTQYDEDKSEALIAMTQLTRKRYWKFDSENLHLKLATKNINVCTLLCLVITKIPIISIQYFIDIDTHFAFNSIRKSKHKNADEIIAYLYEILNIQQKIAISLHSLIGSIMILNDKYDSVMHQSEVDATLEIEHIITALKSSIEKTVFLLGYIFNITNLESKKTHKTKLTALSNGIPENVKKQPYYGFVEKFISSQELETLNQYRTGLLHKKGLSKLQPHSHYKKSDTIDIFTDFFHKLHEQHSKNSAIIIVVSAILTDELVKLDKPDFNLEDIPCEELEKYWRFF